MENTVTIEQLTERKDGLKRLLDSYYRYRELLDEFKFEKMKYVRAYDKFTEAVQVYEDVDRNDEKALAQAEENYNKWKDMASKDYDNTQTLKTKGDAALRELKALKKLFLPEASTENFDLTVQNEIEAIEKQIEGLQ